MKNTFFLLAIGLFFTTGIFAQATKKSAPAKLTVPEVVSTSFNTTFSQITESKWSKNYSGYYVVNFKNEADLQQTAEYNSEGVLLKSKTIYALSVLPQNVTMSVETKYAGAKIDACEKVNIPGIAPYYRVKLVTADLTPKEILVGEEGSIVRS